MFGRNRSQDEMTQREAAHGREVRLLRNQIARLENALAVAITSPVQNADAPEHGAPQPAAPEQGSDSGFAAAWSRVESQSVTSEKFFDTAHTDQRARKWLLTPA